MWSKDIVGSKKIWVPKKFWVQKKFWVKKNFMSKTFIEHLPDPLKTPSRHKTLPDTFQTASRHHQDTFYTHTLPPPLK